MSFVSLEYVLFLGVVAAIYWCLPLRAQNALLVAASLVFYGWVEPWLVTLLLYSAVLDFVGGYGAERWRRQGHWFLAMSVAGNLGLLAVFKYFDFFVGSFVTALGKLGLHVDPFVLGLALPAGLSFYTFQSLAYTTDVYRGRLRAVRDPLNFLLFVSFFPQLVAGPINRAVALLPQLERPRVLDWDRVRSGLSLIAWGAVQKVVLSDTLRGFSEAPFFQEAPAGPVVWTAAFAGNVMMFADFAGYTNMARGSARILGVELAENFRAPFLARTPAEWWTRWHVTLYDWIRDYVFHPLVLTPWCRRWLVPWRNPPAWVHPVRGMVLSMVLSGLWHGADWHFVAWGGYFAALQLAYFAFERNASSRLKGWRYGAWVQRPLMALWLSISTILFREADPSRVRWMLTRSPLVGTMEDYALAVVILCVTAIVSLPMVAVWWTRERGAADSWAASPLRLPLEATWWSLAAWLVFVFLKGTEFEYVHF